MEHDFWHNKWEIQQIGFHLDYIHPILKRSIGLFAAQKKVFVPLCGKSLDIGYLLGQGCQVVGVELSEIAVSELFEQLQLKPSISIWGQGKRYQAQDITIFVGDFFAITAADLGNVAWVYDRGALIALPDELRVRYSKHLDEIACHAPQLLITLDYDQDIASGPPFAISGDEVMVHYGQSYQVKLLEEADIIEDEPKFKAKGLPWFFQRAYHLC
mgnify:CR=1 FL=1